MPFSHRPSSLHQANKPYKSKSKRAIKSLQKGKVDRSNHGNGPKSNVLADSKANRKNAAKVKILSQREKAKHAHRMFTGRVSVPKIGAIIPLSKTATAASFLGSIQGVEGCKLSWPHNATGLNLPASCQLFDSKQSVQWISCEREHSGSDYAFMLNVLDSCKAADFVVFLVAASEDVDEVGSSILSAINAQGNLSGLLVVQGLAAVAMKKHTILKRIFAECMEREYSQSVKVFNQESNSELFGLLRSILNVTVSTIRWRDFHPYMLVHDIEQEEEDGCVNLVGYSRGHPFCADRLVHIPSFGDFAIDRIEDLDSGRIYTNASNEEILFENDAEQCFSDGEDDVSGHSMIYDESADKSSNTPAKPERKLPSGTSEYQAAWIVDSDSESDIAPDNDRVAFSDESVNETQGTRDRKEQNEDEESDIENDNEQLEEYLKSRKTEMTPEDDVHFPDEVETPLDIPARFKFRDYRGLKSFRTSTWDKNENLPSDYSRIFQFQNFANTKRRLSSLLEEERLNAGNCDRTVTASMDTDEVPDFNGPDSQTRIRISLRNVPPSLLEFYRKTARPIVVFGLFNYEERMSVLNMTLIKPKFRSISSFDEDVPPVENNSQLTIQCGFRRYNQEILVSQYSNGNLHKMESFIHPGKSVVISVYGQIHLYSEPVLFFVPPTSGRSAVFLGSGSLESADPGRMIIERKILTGIPTRIHPSHHRNTAIIKFMFFNEEDVLYFKPIELKTKLGRRGHILSSIGIHGAMKCGFDKPLKSMDTVCLMLYKRVFPKWPKSGYKSLFGEEVANGEIQLADKDSHMIEI